MAKERSRGLWFAGAMLALMAFECLVLAEIVFGESVTGKTGPGRRLLTAYWVLVTVSLALQVAGIHLVLEGRYRLGGALQIVACVIHLPKLEGVIGLVGGLRARACAKQPGDSIPDPAP